jgi:hypothetical protein
VRPLHGVRRTPTGQGVSYDLRPCGPGPRRGGGPRAEGGRPRYRLLRRGGDRGGGHLLGAGGALPSGQGALPGGLPRNLPPLRRGQESNGVRLFRGNEARAVRGIEDLEGKKGVSDAESETTRLEVPPGQTQDSQETGRSRPQHLPAVQADETAPCRMPELRNVQRPGSHFQGLTPVSSCLR